MKFKNKVCLLRGFLYLDVAAQSISFWEINCECLTSYMSNNKKIYTLVICYDEETETVEWVQETLLREEELPDNIYETKELTELEEFEDQLPNIIEVAEA